MSVSFMLILLSLSSLGNTALTILLFKQIGKK